MANPPVWLICPWGSGDIAEFVHPYIAPPANMTVVTPPGSPPADMGSYCARVVTDANPSLMTRVLTAYLSNVKNGAIGFRWRPDTNPGSGMVQIVGAGNGSLNNIHVGWKASDKKFYLVDYLGTTEVAGPTTTVFDAASAAWYWVCLRWETPGVAGVDSKIWLGIWDSNRVFVEELYVENGSTIGAGGTTANRIFLGLVSGIASSVWHIGNLYLQQGSAIGAPYTPVAPNIVAQVMNSGPGANNYAAWVTDTGADDSVNEYLKIDEIPPVDTNDYLKCVLAGFDIATQYYGHAAGLVPAGNAVLAVAVVGRRWEDAASDALQQSRMLLGAVEVASPAVLLGADSTYTYETGLFRATDPSDRDWTIPNLDAMRPGHRVTGTAGEQRVSQLILYAAYQPATATPSTLIQSDVPISNPVIPPIPIGF